MSDNIFIGHLKGEQIPFFRVLKLEINYHKRSREEYQRLRAEFTNVERRKFLKSLANSSKKRSVLQKSGITRKEIDLMREGILPDGWQVHHKLPLDDNGKNDFGNLIVIKNDPYHMALTNEQSRLTRGLKEGEARQITFPIPLGFVYAPETKITKFKRLESEASDALEIYPLICIATHAKSPAEAWQMANDLDWGDCECKSVKALAKIYFKYGEDVYINLIEQKASAIFNEICFCACHREKEIEDCECCNQYKSKCFCACHFCIDCRTNQNYCGEDDFCDCDCHEDSSCCDDCASLCWCGCHNCSECHDNESDCEGEAECNCNCHESCDDCSTNHEDEDDEDDYDEDEDDEDDDVSVKQIAPGVFRARLLDENKNTAGYFEFERDGNGFRCRSITWREVDMNSITITNNYGQTQTIYDGEYFDLTIKGGGVHNFH